jgi:hypothetical protein
VPCTRPSPFATHSLRAHVVDPPRIGRLGAAVRDDPQLLDLPGRWIEVGRQKGHIVRFQGGDDTADAAVLEAMSNMRASLANHVASAASSAGQEVRVPSRRPWLSAWCGRSYIMAAWAVRCRYC